MFKVSAQRARYRRFRKSVQPNLKRKVRKAQTVGQHRDRNAQLENIVALKQRYADRPNPILNMDAKKKELLGNCYRDGQLYTRTLIETFDHDFRSAAGGVVIIHGLWDHKCNQGYLHLGTNHDTSEFACDDLYRWWRLRSRAVSRGHLCASAV